MLIPPELAGECCMWPRPYSKSGSERPMDVLWCPCYGVTTPRGSTTNGCALHAVRGMPEHARDMLDFYAYIGLLPYLPLRAVVDCVWAGGVEAKKLAREREASKEWYKHSGRNEPTSS